MQTRNRVFDDLAKVANGAVSTLTGIKGEVEALVRQQIDRLLAEMDLVPREEFEAVKAVAAKARTEQEKLERRVAELEAAAGIKSATRAKPARKRPATAKTAKPKSTGANKTRAKAPAAKPRRRGGSAKP